MAPPDQSADWHSAESAKGLKFSYFTKPIEKSQQDDRDYRLIRLENGLHAMLIHDAKADKAAASLDVAVGHLYDPADMPGLAHFCEHLLFMGTEQYPKENEYSEYLSKNNGSSNAYTATSNTNYYFNVAPSALPGAISRFSGFFHSPLFAPSCTVRELNAVDSEHKKNHQNDVWRIFQLNKHLTKEGHVWNKFGSGNKDSLTRVGREAKAAEAAEKKRFAAESMVNGNGNGNGFLTPNASAAPSRIPSPAPSVNSAISEGGEADGGLVGRETRRRLIEWWSKEYCASRMRLCVIGKDSLDDLAEMVTENFSPIKNRDQEPLPMILDHPFGPGEKSTLVSVQTIMSFHILEISFPLAYQPPLWRHKPGTFLAGLVGHEGPGSLHSYLKNKGWLTALSAGPQNLGRGFAMFKVTLHMTKDGFANYREAALAVFSYLSLLRSSALEPWHQKEFSQLLHTRFRFAEKSRPDDYAVWMTEQMAWPTPRELVVKAPQVVWEWDEAGEAEKEVRRTLEGLRVSEGRAVLMGRKEEHVRVGGEGEWENEPWYGTEYKVVKMDEEFVRLADGPCTVPELHLPGPNEFVPTNLDVEKKEVSVPQPRPHLIRETELTTLWHKKDDQFWVPKASVILDIRSPFADDTPLATVMTRLYSDLVEDSLTEYVYDADLAGLSYNFSSSSSGMYVQVQGYNDKLHVLLQHVLERIKTIQVKRDRVEVMKEQLKRSWENYFLGQSYRISDYYGRYLMSERQWTLPEKLKVLPSVTEETIQAHISKLLSKTHVHMLVGGNLYKDEAINLAKMTEEILGSTSLPSDEVVDLALLLPKGSNFVFSMPVPNPNEPNSALSYYTHFGPTTSQHLRVTADLLTQILSEPAFDILRTKEQLGYIVSASQWLSSGSGHTGLRIVVQSERCPVYLEERVEAFLEHMKGVLEGMSEEAFQEQKDGLREKWQEAPKNVGQEMTRYWAQIESGYLDFMRRQNNVAHLKNVTKEDVLSLFMSNVHPSSATRSKLSVHAISQKPRTKHVSPAALQAFVELARQQSSSTSVDIDEIPWKDEFGTAENEPSVLDFSKFWKTALEEKGAEGAKLMEGLFEALPELVKQFPAKADYEGVLPKGVKKVEDVEAFKKSLMVSERPRALVQWGDLPTPHL